MDKDIEASEELNDFMREPHGLAFGLFAERSGLHRESSTRDLDEAVAEWIEEHDRGRLRR